MNSKVVVCLLLLGLTMAMASLFSENLYEKEFSSFVLKYNKKYGHDQFFFRYSTFKTNYDFIHRHNAGNYTYTLKMNSFGDMPFDEFHATHTGFNYIRNNYIRSKNTAPHSHIDSPADSLDWRSKGAVTGVKDQGQCGSCWAFSATGSMEGAYEIKHSTLLSFSEQELVDCSGSYGNDGCEGGLMDQAFEYVKDSGISAEDDYPYTAQDGNCNTKAARTPLKLTGYVDVKVNDDSALAAAAMLGPVSVAIEADQAVFQFYSGGILNDDSCGDQLDHGVLVVGYDTDATAGNYWIVKNSWGGDWGVQGYIYMARKDKEGQCGINMAASYPTVA